MLLIRIHILNLDTWLKILAISRNSVRMEFKTDYVYTDRKTKAKYVWLKYQQILKGRILDVGAGDSFLREYLSEEADYCAIGLARHLDRQVDLEKEAIPFSNNSFDCVICLDVLEHLDNIHEVFDELCRVTRKWLIISMPNPWGNFFQMLLKGHNSEKNAMKFYKLPLEQPEDRHKWFFSTEEAIRFIDYRATKNHMRVVKKDLQGYVNKGLGLRTLIRKTIMRILFSSEVKNVDFYTGPLWVVLKKDEEIA
jgi:2-polyprenyl-3-methyl-5-hydroxy-6-metoxy-1,4-benzoquinol methylase